MKIVLTGSLGNISKPLAIQLIAARNQVTIVSSQAAKAAAIEAIGAAAAIGSVEDAAFLTGVFTGADVVYTMIPPNFGVPDLRAYMGRVGNSYATAIKNAGITRVVNLSSIGAHLSEGTGPIKGVHDTELLLNQLPGVAVKHLRAPFFFTNFFNDIPMIKHQGIMGANYPAATRLVMVHPEDIAAAVAEEIQLPFNGKTVRYLASDESTPGEAAKLLGNAIGKPGLPWVTFTDEQALNGMLQAGIPQEMAENFTEMGTALRAGKLWEDFDNHQPASRGKWRLADFATVFAAAYNN
ncbi:NmrA family NAD(P)-binding protein [Deminuibacter soli]|uniref:NAD-dependent dehydratase n=1 Tax=Deminuibacter soli TaxID=2291815 RepID=A0A3E1NCR6_9BACT|nr:NAD(P)H-binding protein [Deminuibacter soli]RFM25799.1 NAD-dependent dehydratase [Deminuibacter soli]